MLVDFTPYWFLSYLFNQLVILRPIKKEPYGPDLKTLSAIRSSGFVVTISRVSFCSFFEMLVIAYRCEYVKELKCDPIGVEDP